MADSRRMGTKRNRRREGRKYTEENIKVKKQRGRE
jgi:hypothetical protein